MSDNEIQENAAETAAEKPAEAAAETSTEATADTAATEVSAATETPATEASSETTEAPAAETTAETDASTDTAAAEAETTTEPEKPEEPEEISYHAVEKEGEITAIWEMQGRKHLRTISARSTEGQKILSLFTSEIHETDSPAMAESGDSAASTEEASA